MNANNDKNMNKKLDPYHRLVQQDIKWFLKKYSDEHEAC